MKSKSRDIEKISDAAPDPSPAANKRQQPISSSLPEALSNQEISEIVSLESPSFKASLEQLKKRESTQRLDALQSLCKAFKNSDDLSISSPIFKDEGTLSSMLNSLLTIFSDTHFLVIQGLMDALVQYTKFLCSNYDQIPFATEHVEKIIAPTFNILFDSKYETIPGIVEDSNIIISYCMKYLKEDKVLSIIGNIIAASSWWRKPAVKRAILNTLDKISLEIKLEYFRNKQNYRVWINKLHPSLSDVVSEIRSNTIKLFNFLYDINPKDYLQIASTFDDSISNQLLSVTIGRNKNVDKDENSDENRAQAVKERETTPLKHPRSAPKSASSRTKETVNLDSPSIPSPIKRRILGESSARKVAQSPAMPRNEWQLASAEILEKFKSGTVDFGTIQKLVKVSRENDSAFWTKGLVGSILNRMFPMILSPEQVISPFHMRRFN